MIHGYARVSTTDQDTDMQIRALRRAGCAHIWSEKGSAIGRRPELHKLLGHLRPGDLLMVYKLDRIARSLRDLLGILDRLERAGASIRSLSEPIDTTTPAGRLMIQVLGAVGEFERSLIRERVVAGQAAARDRGQTWGRVRQFSHEESKALADWWRGGWAGQRDLADMLDVHPATVRDAIHKVEGRGRYAPDGERLRTSLK